MTIVVISVNRMRCGVSNAGLEFCEARSRIFREVWVSEFAQNGYSYDAASNRKTLTAPDGSTNTYNYDTLNRLSTLTNSLTGQFGFGYDALSRRTQLTRPNGINTNYSYDSLSRLLSVLHQAGSTTLDGASYVYDFAGNRTSKTNYLNNVTEGYTYDPIYQLTQVTQGGSTTESYSYDAVGNRLSSVGVNPYSYNASNQLTATPSGSYTYDNNGNTLTDPSGKSYTWDFENRLVSAVVPGTGTVTFKYDPFGRRIQKSSALGTTNYLHDGPNLLEQVDQSGNVVARYTQGSAADELLAQVRSGTTSYYEADGLSSVTSLTSPSGTVAATYSYDSFGQVLASTGTVTNSFRYTGRELDLETGIYYYRARYYNPASGRFLSEDPIRFKGGIDFYGYVHNSSPNSTDPTGMWSTAAHHQIIWNALHLCGVSNADIWQMQQGSDFADSFAFQGGEWSSMHAMSNGNANQSPSDAQNQTAQFVADQMNNAVNVYNSGGNDSAMFLFGLAMHPLMDLTSPAHTDQNGNPIPWCGIAPWSCSQLSQHGDSPWSIEDLSHLNANPEVQELENIIIRNWFEALTGQTLHCDKCAK